MKFTQETTTILKNFSSINPSILLKPGNKLRTISPLKTVLAEADISESITKKAAIYDLNRFLSTLGLFDSEPEIEFGDNKFQISLDESKVDYIYAAENMIVVPPDKNIQADYTLKVHVKANQLQKVIQAAGVLSCSDIAFIGDGDNIYLAAIDSKNPTSDNFKVKIDSLEHDPFKMLIKVEHFKVLPQDYEVNLSIEKNIAYFDGNKIKYWIAIQAS